MGTYENTAIAEFHRRNKNRQKELLANETLERECAKQKLRENLSEDAIFSLTYVPYVIAEVAWDYADSVLDIAALMRIYETKRLSRTIREIRKEYDRKRYKVINDSWRSSETDNMIMFQEELKGVFNNMYDTYKSLLTSSYGQIVPDSLMMICGAYMCHTVLKALFQYELAQIRVVSDIIGYQFVKFLPQELRTLYDLITEFAGDCVMPESFKEIEDTFAKEIAKYIIEVEINDTNTDGTSIKVEDDSKQKLTSYPKYELTMKELIQKLGETAKAFISNATENVEKGNKAAGVRARKASLELEKLMKEYRKRSVKPETEE